jgi:hypothetical protein
MIPLGTFAFIVSAATGLYVYFDAERRSQSRAFAAGLAIAVSLCYWPISFLMYIACTVVIDRRRVVMD